MHKFLRLVFWAALAFTLVMALLPKPPHLIESDKVQHILAFLVLTVLGCVSYPRIRTLVLAVALAAFGAAIELLQMIPALNRDSSAIDWIADGGAIVAGLLLARTIRHWRMRTAEDMV